MFSVLVIMIDEPSIWPWVRDFTNAEELYYLASTGDRITAEGVDQDVLIRRKEKPQLVLITNDQKKMHNSDAKQLIRDAQLS